MIKASLLVIFAFLLLPIYWMLIGSFQDIRGIMAMPPKMWPSNFTTANYTSMAGWPVLTWAFNSIVVMAATAGLSVVLSATAGYSFAFFELPFKRALWLLLLLGIMIPRISLLIPLYVTVKQIGISGSLPAVILPVAFSPVGLYMARTYFETVPRSLLESARLDGANEAQILFHVVAPVSRPIITALGLFAAIGALQDFVWQMLVLQKENLQTLLVGLMRAVMVRGGAELNINPMGRSLAVGVVLLAPLVMIFVVANKYFTESIGGAIKE